MSEWEVIDELHEVYGELYKVLAVSLGADQFKLFWGADTKLVKMTMTESGTAYLMPDIVVDAISDGAYGLVAQNDRITVYRRQGGGSQPFPKTEGVVPSVVEPPLWIQDARNQDFESLIAQMNEELYHQNFVGNSHRASLKVDRLRDNERGEKDLKAYGRKVGFSKSRLKRLIGHYGYKKARAIVEGS